MRFLLNDPTLLSYFFVLLNKLYTWQDCLLLELSATEKTIQSLSGTTHLSKVFSSLQVTNNKLQLLFYIRKCFFILN